MSEEIHIVIDNMFPTSLPRELREFWATQFPRWTIRHENDVARASSPDSHWIGRLKEIHPTGDWLIVTADEGRGDSKECEKLPVLCKRHGHAYVVLGETLRKASLFKAAIASVFPQFPQIVEASHTLKHHPKTHVKLGLKGDGGVSSFVLRIKGRPLAEWMSNH